MPKGYTIISSTEKILLDSNAYFRLADNFYPLFSRTFGKDHVYQLFILSGTIHEYNYQARLRSKFDWVNNERHRNDRNHCRIKLIESQKKSIKETCRFLQSDCDERKLGCSPFDIECLATAYELNMTLVTDDLDLSTLAGIYDYPVLSTLELLKKLLSTEVIAMKEIRDCIYMWRYFNDTPSDYLTEFKKLFGEEYGD